MIQVKVSNLSISNVGFVLLLKSVSDERTLPIFIGVPEAQAIAIQLNQTAPPRPLTHDLLKNLLDILEGRLESVEVNELKEGTFFGRLLISFEGQTIALDARPSDAVALALRYKAPIYVTEAVMNEASMIIEPEDQEVAPLAGGGKPVGKAVRRSPAEELQAQLELAIKEERYEDAARIRDQLKQQLNIN
jgi:bifunctional DNase/RNase